MVQGTGDGSNDQMIFILYYTNAVIYTKFGFLSFLAYVPVNLEIDHVCFVHRNLAIKIESELAISR